MTEAQRQLIASARALQLGPDWSRIQKDRVIYMRRIQALADKLAEVTNALESAVGGGKK